MKGRDCIREFVGLLLGIPKPLTQSGRPVARRDEDTSGVRKTLLRDVFARQPSSRAIDRSPPHPTL